MCCDIASCFWAAASSEVPRPPHPPITRMNTQHSTVDCAAKLRCSVHQMSSLFCIYWDVPLSEVEEHVWMDFANVFLKAHGLFAVLLSLAAFQNYLRAFRQRAHSRTSEQWTQAAPVSKKKNFPDNPSVYLQLESVASWISFLYKINLTQCSTSVLVPGLFTLVSMTENQNSLQIMSVIIYCAEQ